MQYLIEKQQLLKQAAADEQLAKELQDQSVQVCYNDITLTLQVATFLTI